MDEREFFDRLAPEWDANEIMSTPERIGKVLDFIDIKPGEAVLDLGTGTGVLLPYIAQKVGEKGRITAIDYSEGMLSRAKEKFSGLVPLPEFLNMDFETDTIEGEFNHIILYCVYPHLHTPVETLKWLQKVNLAPGGDITIAFPSGPDFINNIHRDRHSESDCLLPAGKLAEFLASQGLDAEALSDSDDCYVVTVRQK